MIPKFRVWNTETKEIEVFKTYEEISELFLALSADDGFYSIMQSTGLKDKNGQEIFEGDIVKRDGIKRPEVVRFGEWIDVDSLGYKEQYIGFYFESEHEGQEWLHSVEPQFNHLYKIIGNIYENPELFEVE